MLNPPPLKSHVKRMETKPFPSSFKQLKTFGRRKLFEEVIFTLILQSIPISQRTPSPLKESNCAVVILYSANGNSRQEHVSFSHLCKFYCLNLHRVIISLVTIIQYSFHKDYFRNDSS